MAIEKWDKNEIARLASVSGKPLEVRCAETFLKAKWRVRLGTYYSDISSEKIRELDFLAEKQASFETRDVNRDSLQWDLRFRIFGSCKGFAPEHAPATYSIDPKTQSVEQPYFTCYECGLHRSHVANSMRQRTASRFLQRTGLASARQVVGVDILQRKEIQKKPPRFEYLRKTDRDLYEGLDSATKAALFWYLVDRRQWSRRVGEYSRTQIALHVPLLVSSLPFWNVSIDQGNPGEPELKCSGFHVGFYPSADSEKSPEPLMSILWEVSKIDELTRHLDGLFEFFVDEIKIAVEQK